MLLEYHSGFCSVVWVFRMGRVAWCSSIFVGCLPYVIRVRVSYRIRNFDFADVRLKCRSTLCFCHYYTFYKLLHRGVGVCGGGS